MIDKIFKLNLSCVKNALLFIDRFSLLIKEKKSASGFLLYNPKTKTYSNYQQDSEVEYQFNLLYHLDNFNSFYKNSFSKNWKSKLEKLCQNYLEMPEAKLLKELVLMSSRESESFCFLKLQQELPQLVTNCIRNGFIKNKESSDIPNIWFYIQLGKLLSSYFSIKPLPKNKEIIYVEKLLNYYEYFIDFKYKNTRSFEPENLYILELFKEYHNDSKWYFYKPLEHYNLKLIRQYTTESKIINAIDFKLKLQYIELSTNLLDYLCKEKLLETIEKKKNEKTLKFFKIIDAKLIFILNDKLPSLIPGEFNYKKSIQDVLLGFDQIISTDNTDQILHESYYLESEISAKAKNILNKLKSENSWRISNDLLYDFLCYYQHCKIKLDFNFIKQIFDFDIEKFDMPDHDKYDFLVWCYDLDNSNRNFFTKNNSIFFNKILNRIKSQKISLNQTLIQGCIMSCFDRFYQNWFFDSRGRFYIQNSALSAQGSKIARFLVQPCRENGQKNLEYVEKTLNSLKVIDIEKIKNYDLMELNQSDAWLNKPKDFFQIYSLLKDYREKNSCRNTYGLDATTSGIQMLGILKKDLNYMTKCGLLKSDENFVGLYEKFGFFIKDKLTAIEKKLLLLNKFDLDFKFNPRAIESELKYQIINLKKNPDNFADLTKCGVDLIEYNKVFLSNLAKNLLNKANYTSNEQNNILLLEMRKFINDLKSIPNLEICLYSRSMAKKPIMTLPYGSSSRGRIDQMIQTYLDDCISKGISFSDTDYKKLQSFFSSVDKIFYQWFHSQMPELKEHALRRNLSNFVKSKVEQQAQIEIISKYSKFRYSKNHQFNVRRNLGIKNSEGKKTSLTISYSLDVFQNIGNETAKKEYIANIISSIVANIAHTMDKDIALDVINMCLDKKIHVHTIHDCFRVDYSNAHQLRGIITKAYINLFSLDILAQLNIQKTELSLDYFKSNLNMEYFVKE